MWTLEQTTILICHLSVALTGACPYAVTLPATYSYQELPLNSVNVSTSLVLEVKACKNAHVAISNSLNLSQNMYEFVFGAGENTYCSIRGCKLGCQLNSTSCAWLSCTEVKTVWVAWGSPGVRMGIGGQVDKNTLVKTTSGASLAVHHVWISMYGGASGDWTIACPESSSAAVTTNSTTQSAMTTVIENASELSSSAGQHETSTALDLATLSQISTSTEQNMATGMAATMLEASPSGTEFVAMTSAGWQSEATSMFCDGAVESSSAVTSLTDSRSQSTTDKQVNNSETTLASVTLQKDFKPFSATFPRCRCEVYKVSPLASELAMKAAEEDAKKIVEELKLKEETSACRRQLESANDRRLSAKFLGTTAVALIAGAAFLVTAPDFLALLVWAVTKLGLVKKASERARH